jgi:phage terminase small subunit
MGGRPPKPTALHVIQGTYRPSRMKRRAREPVPIGSIADPPDWLLPEAKRIWREVVAGYGDSRVLTSLDGPMLAVYSQMAARMIEGEKSGTPVTASWIAAMANIGGKLGLNPSDRVRLQVPPLPPEPDPTERYLTG